MRWITPAILATALIANGCSTESGGFMLGAEARLEITPSTIASSDVPR